MPIKTMYLVRHGETDWNLANKIQGSTDIPLNENGRQQARELAEKLAGMDKQVACIYTSGLQRALETAQIIGNRLGMEPVVSPGLKEICMGEWEGLTWKQVRESDSESYQQWYNNRRYTVPPQGESYEQLLQRLMPVLRQMMSESTGDVLVVTHSAVIMTLMSYIYDTPFCDMAKNYRTANARIVEMTEEQIGKERKQGAAL